MPSHVLINCISFYKKYFVFSIVCTYATIYKRMIVLFLLALKEISNRQWLLKWIFLLNGPSIFQYNGHSLSSSQKERKIKSKELPCLYHFLLSTSGQCIRLGRLAMDPYQWRPLSVENYSIQINITLEGSVIVISTCIY